MIFFIVIVIIIFIIFLVLLFNRIRLKKILVHFKKNNVVVAGKKGDGKDVLFQYVINERKEDYYSNISYGKRYNAVRLREMSVGENTYKNFVEENIVKSEHKFIEARDFYISDAGVYLPSYMDSTLYKLYPSLPIFYALSRHLYNANVHANVQNYGRLWKALREQADYFITCRKTIKLPFILITFITGYDKLASAESELRPLKARIMNKYSKAEVDMYKAQNGNIIDAFIIQRKRKIYYNTRAFEDICLTGDRLLPNKKCKLKKLK